MFTKSALQMELGIGFGIMVYYTFLKSYIDKIV
jgi:hypothetical protein